MSGRSMVVSVLVKLVDGLTSPLRGMMRGITGIGSGIANIGRQIGIVGGALAAISLASPIQQAAAYDTVLRDIAITAGKTGGAVESMIGDIGARYQKLAIETGQRSMDLAKGAQTLIASNMDPALIDKLMPTIARVATATGATMEDTAKTAFSLSDALKVPADQMEAMLGKLVVAGKLGRFEFKNMATEFPGLTAQMQKFGITGKEAVETLGASLQIAMLGTANPSEAATNLTNFLTKINAPEAIKKFEKELKVDVTGVMTDAAAKGINPIEAVLEKMTSKLAPQQAEIDKIMKKAGITDKEREGQIKTLLAGTKVGKLYADMQVLGFVLPFLQNREKYLAFRKEIAASGVDVIAADFASRMRGLSQSLLMFGEIGTQVMRRVGLAFASNLPMANAAIIQLLEWTARIDAKWPGLIDGVLSWAGALLAAGAGIAILTPVFSALAAAIALLISPIGLVIAGIAALAAGAAYLYQNWSTVGPQLSALWTDIGAKFSAAWESIRSGQALEGLIAWLGTKIPELATAVINNLPAMVDAGGKLLTSLGEGMTTGLVAIVAMIASVVAQIGAAIVANAAVLAQAGASLITALWDGMKAKFDELIAWVSGKISELTGMLKLPGLLGGGAAAPDAQSGIKNAPAPATDPMGNPLGGFNPTSNTGGGSIGGSNGFAKTAANQNVAVGGRIVVEASEGTRVVNVQSTNPAVPVTPNRGSMLGRA